MKHIFGKYCTPPSSTSHEGKIALPDGAHLTSQGLDDWAIATNGKAFDNETKEELVDYMDVTEDGHLT